MSFAASLTAVVAMIAGTLVLIAVAAMRSALATTGKYSTSSDRLLSWSVGYTTATFTQ